MLYSRGISCTPTYNFQPFNLQPSMLPNPNLSKMFNQSGSKRRVANPIQDGPQNTTLSQDKSISTEAFITTSEGEVLYCVFIGLSPSQERRLFHHICHL